MTKEDKRETVQNAPTRKKSNMAEELKRGPKTLSLKEKITSSINHAKKQGDVAATGKAEDEFGREEIGSLRPLEKGRSVWKERIWYDYQQKPEPLERQEALRLLPKRGRFAPTVTSGGKLRSRKLD